MTSGSSAAGTVRLKLTADADPAERAIIGAGLVEFNEARAGLLNACPLNVLLMDAQGATIGGLWGRTYWHWLYVELLFVPAPLRGTKLGARLLGAAEDEARRRHCVGVWLDTVTFQAPRFYEKQGYRPFGRLSDYPPGFDRIFFTKTL